MKYVAYPKMGLRPTPHPRTGGRLAAAGGQIIHLRCACRRGQFWVMAQSAMIQNIVASRRVYATVTGGPLTITCGGKDRSIGSLNNHLTVSVKRYTGVLFD